MIKQPSKVSVFNYGFALGVSEVFFLTSFYLSILDVSYFAVALPFSAVFLLVSLYFFIRTDKVAKTLYKQRVEREAVYSFYHKSFGIFLIIIAALICIALAYLPFIQQGGHFYILYCVPMAILCLVPCITSYKGMKLSKLNIDKASPHIDMNS